MAELVAEGWTLNNSEVLERKSQFFSTHYHGQLKSVRFLVKKVSKICIQAIGRTVFFLNVVEVVE